MNFKQRLLIYLILNFAALAIGSWLMGDAVTSSWYQNLNKAPWTPPGWVFGAAWTIVMITFSVFMAYATSSKNIENLITLKVLFWIQWLLNVSWNYIFFNMQMAEAGLIEILTLFIVLGFIFYVGFLRIGVKSFWLLPYLTWLVIAISLNAFIVAYN